MIKQNGKSSAVIYTQILTIYIETTNLQYQRSDWNLEFFNDIFNEIFLMLMLF